jgi:hypothetical protein
MVKISVKTSNPPRSPRASSAIIDWISAASWHGALCAVMAKEGAASSMSRIIRPA